MRTRNSWLGSASLHILANYYLAVYCGVEAVEFLQGINFPYSSYNP
jgi:hypothetical protein